MNTIEPDRGNQTDFQAELTAQNQSALEKYRSIAVGGKGFGDLLEYEAACWFLSPMPGALGYFLRGKFYPKLLKSAGRGLVMGRNINLRHPRRISIGNGVFIDDNCTLDAKGKSEEGIRLGDGVALARNTILSCKGGSITVGNNSNISANCMLISESSLAIGENVLIAGLCYIIAGGNHGIDRVDIPIIRQQVVQKGGVRIEDNAWLGANVTILDGVTIGRDSIIGAGAVVTRDIPEFAIALGVPAKVVKYRK